MQLHILKIGGPLSYSSRTTFGSTKQQAATVVLCKNCQMALQVCGGCYNIYSYYLIEKGEIKWLKKLLQHLD